MVTAPKKYSLEFRFNGELKRKKTDDIDKAIQQVAPTVLFTEMYVKIKKDGVAAERRLSLTDAKRIFRNEVNREVFINNLLVEYVN